MTIEKSTHEEIINDIKVGNSVAEDDAYLQYAKVETPVFYGVLNDEYDIVPGRKGAGKTAIFRIISALSGFLLVHRKLVILTGVDSAGEPVFNKFKANFSKFSEDDFENFWKLYFISLIYNDFLKNPKFKSMLNDCDNEIKEFKTKCNQAGIPDIPAVLDKFGIITWIISTFPRLSKITNTTVYDAEKLTLFSAITQVEFDKNQAKSESQKQALYVNYIGDALGKILKKSGLKIWIILDRLDEVFDRYSSIEFNGLRWLLKAYKSFDIGHGSDLFRIKIFLRDDIKLFLTNAKIFKKFFPGKNLLPLAAATHIFDRESATLSWSIEEIEQLILNRLLLSQKLRDYLGISRKYSGLKDDQVLEELKKELRNKKNRSEYWNKIFPEKIQTTTSLKWIFVRLKDSNGVVTPRSVIDMLVAAIDFQKKNSMVNYEDSNEVFSVDSLKSGLDIASKHKLERDIFNEFPREQENIKKLEMEGKPKLSKKDLRRLYGNDWNEVVESLRRMGILRYIKDSDAFTIEFLFRPALNITYKH
jgi:hypothetical protein